MPSVCAALLPRRGDDLQEPERGEAEAEHVQLLVPAEGRDERGECETRDEPSDAGPAMLRWRARELQWRRSPRRPGSSNSASSSGAYSCVVNTVQSTAPRNATAPEVERELHRLGQLAGRGDVAHLEEIREQPRQRGRDHRADADEPALHRVAEAALPVGQHVAYQRAERLHRNIDRRVEDPQHAGRDPQVRAVRHHHERGRGEQRADQEVRPAAAQAAPGAVAHVADDGLHDQPGERRGKPEDRQLVDGRAERLEDAAHVRVLQREAELDAEEAETHVPDLPETESGLFLVHVRRPGARGLGLAKGRSP